MSTVHVGPISFDAVFCYVDDKVSIHDFIQKDVVYGLKINDYLTVNFRNNAVVSFDLKGKIYPLRLLDYACLIAGVPSRIALPEKLFQKLPTPKRVNNFTLDTRAKMIGYMGMEEFDMLTDTDRCFVFRDGEVVRWNTPDGLLILRLKGMHGNIVPVTGSPDYDKFTVKDNKIFYNNMYINVTANTANVKLLKPERMLTIRGYELSDSEHQRLVNAVSAEIDF